MASNSSDDKASTAPKPRFSYASYLALPDDDSFDWPSDFENGYIQLSLNGDPIIRPAPAPAPVPAPEPVPVPSPARVAAIPASDPPAPPRGKTKRKRAKKAPVKGRKCSHCSTEKTLQWRLGPEGPNTLCNACWVRYKSGRLVPEYRPAKSPTLDPMKHSNSHKKVLELRKEMGSPAPEEGSPAV